MEEQVKEGSRDGGKEGRWRKNGGMENWKQRKERVKAEGGREGGRDREGRRSKKRKDLRERRIEVETEEGCKLEARKS